MIFCFTIWAKLLKRLQTNKGWSKIACADPEGRTGGPDPPLQFHKNIGFLSNTGLDPLKITKLLSQHLILGHYRHTHWRAEDGSLIVVLASSLHSSTKKRVKFGPLSPSSWQNFLDPRMNWVTLTRSILENKPFSGQIVICFPPDIDNICSGDDRWWWCVAAIFSQHCIEVIESFTYLNQMYHNHTR